jgi:hypothetical protein
LSAHILRVCGWLNGLFSFPFYADLRDLFFPRFPWLYGTSCINTTIEACPFYISIMFAHLPHRVVFLLVLVGLFSLASASQDDRRDGAYIRRQTSRREIAERLERPAGVRRAVPSGTAIPYVAPFNSCNSCSSLQDGSERRGLCAPNRKQFRQHGLGEYLDLRQRAVHEAKWECSTSEHLFP